jgi:hypothetical protein
MDKQSTPVLKTGQALSQGFLAMPTRKSPRPAVPPAQRYRLAPQYRRLSAIAWPRSTAGSALSPGPAVPPAQRYRLAPQHRRLPTAPPPQYARANSTRRALGAPVSTQAPGPSSSSPCPSMGMQRMVALVFSLIAASVSAVPSQWA